MVYALKMLTGMIVCRALILLVVSIFTAGVISTGHAAAQGDSKSSSTPLMRPPYGEKITLTSDDDLKPGDVFADCSGCPHMVVVPAGSFVMGARAYDEHARPDFEVPQREFTFDKPFAIGRFEITEIQYFGCQVAKICEPDKPLKIVDKATGKQFGEVRTPTKNYFKTYPAVKMSLSKIEAYLTWLRGITGKPYRLPSEVEWEYAARGGTDTIFWWGDSLEDGLANCRGCRINESGRKGSGRPMPVGSFPPNPFGLYDVIGNAHEAVADCFKIGLSHLPDDGSSYQDDNCALLASKGGSYEKTSFHRLRLSRRSAIKKKTEYYENTYIGFRVVLPLK